MLYNTRNLLCAISVILFLYTQYGPYVESRCVLKTTRSTESTKDLFIGRCLHFQTFVNSAPFCSEPKNCSTLWELFLSGFAHQTPCNSSSDGFKPFLDAAYHDTPRDKLIFWSGVYDLVTRYTNNGKKRISVTNTLTGYLVDGLTFCGSNTSVDGNEADLTSCKRCPDSTYAAFWSIASINYAQSAKGSIEIMLNASRSPAFRSNSFFGSKELPNLNSNVTSARLILVHYVGYQPKETCSSPSVKNLTSILTSKNIQTVCVEQPRDVEMLQCADFPGSQPAACNNIFVSSGSARQGVSMVASVAVAIISVILWLV
ncbi:ADP-ribosyl cyclase/cyclic ADP-ribose hydrolase-like [Pecten maximus]|uniref:ADP-ribosyl cyclase/cyclic ADP-ribose hydrolase-like n=1 Tax=Pecten maximus TaxID=6579 RepID=UPI0014588B0E|nr:ADP-ribosyl cyclase/cyclic ADP-ribose hydrolase-like [Pecten maximus]